MPFTTPQYEPKLVFTGFTVNMIFGFVASPQGAYDEWFRKAVVEAHRSPRQTGSGWTPFYPLPTGAHSVLRRSLTLADFQVSGTRDEAVTFLDTEHTDEVLLTINVRPPPVWGEREDMDSIKAQVSFSYALKEGGAGALTVRLECQPRKKEKAGDYRYTVADVLVLLLVAPRTEFGHLVAANRNDSKNNPDDVAQVSTDGNGDLDGQIDSELQKLKDEFFEPFVNVPEDRRDFSPAFKLFILGMIGVIRSVRDRADHGGDHDAPPVIDQPPEPNPSMQMGAGPDNEWLAVNGQTQSEEGSRRLRKPLLKWEEFGICCRGVVQDDGGDPPQRSDSCNEANQPCCRDGTSPLYSEAIRDPQIPYFYVVGSVPKGIYYEAFAENGMNYVGVRRARVRYSKDIAAIIHRWLIDSNIGYASYDHIEREGMGRHGAFLSNYMSSLVFSTFSGAAALTLQPEKDDEREALPLDPARHSILSFIEFSRMRWHQAISINRYLDELIGAITTAELEEMPPLLRNLLELRLKVGKYMQNPISYRWDATVGTAVARYIHQQIIAELEEATSRKLTLVKELIVDRVDLLRTEESVRMLKEERYRINKQ